MEMRSDVIINGQGVPVAGASVLVKTWPAGDLASIFDVNGVALANPFTSQDGSFAFAAVNGKYTTTTSSLGIPASQSAPFILYDPADDTTGSTLSSQVSTNTSNIATNTTAINTKVTASTLAASGGAATVGFNPTGGVAASNVQAAIAELDNEKARTDTLAASGGAALVGFAPSGGLSATTAQAALVELDTEKARKDDLAGTGGAALVGTSDGSTVQAKLTANASSINSNTSAIAALDITDAGYASLQAAVTAAAGRRLLVNRQWTLTASVAVDSNTTITLSPSALVTTATPNIALFTATGKSNVHFRGTGKMQQTVAGTSAYIGAIVFDTCTDCSVADKIEFVGFQWAGVYIVNSLRCKVLGGYFHDWLGSVDNSAAVIIYQDAHDNVVDGIHAKATGWMGAYVQDPGGAGTYNPQRNKIRKCRIEGTTAYGAMLYINHPGNSYNEITECTITGVTGTAGSGQYGMGIYAVGSALGGCKLLDNSVSDCCKNQTVTTNGHGGITITGNAAGYVKPIVAGNSVDGMTQGCGIEAASMLGGVVIGVNTVNLPASNNGTGPGGAALLGHALMIFNCNDVTVAPGDYVTAGTGSAVMIKATDNNYSNIALNVGNAVAVGSAIVTQRTSSYMITGSISGGAATSTSDSGTAMQLQGFSGPISGVTLRTKGTSSATAALSLSGCTNVRFSNMDVESTGSYSVSIGSSTGNWDKNCHTNARFENSASGFKTEFYSAGIPTVGIYQISDRAVNSSVVVGAAKAWSRATAGSNHVLGTDWISEGNL